MPIIIIGMLDEREAALRLLKKSIQAKGHQTVLADISIGKGAAKPKLLPEISGDDLAEAAGTSFGEIKELVAAKEEKHAAALISKGLANKVLAHYAASDLRGIVAVAGMTGSLISLPAMQHLPFGLPKLLISSAMAMPSHARGLSGFFGMRDITVMHSVVDTVGLNPFVRTLMRNAAGSICGMAESFSPLRQGKKPALAMTEWGYCDMGAHYIRTLLEARYEIVSFHANGIGDKAAVELMDQGLFEAFIDLAPGGFSEHLLGGNRSAGPDRLNVARRPGKPYILSPCGFDMIGCGPIQRKDEQDPLWTSRKLALRKLFIQDDLRVQARTAPEEMKTIALAMAKTLNRHPDKERVKIVVPLKGFSSLSVKDGPLYDPDADNVYIEALKRTLDSKIEILSVDNHINSREFAGAVVAALQRATL